MWIICGGVAVTLNHRGICLKVARRLLHRPMLVYRMRHLLVIDGIPVSDEERAKAELYFMEQQVNGSI